MKFSITTPSYNQCKWLKLCIASVSDQTGVFVEHIVQDAGSNDGTLEWLPADPRVKAFVEKDSGMYDAINRGFKRSDGDVFAWLNCDEQYLPGTLAKVADFFTRHPTVDVVFGDAVLLDKDGSLLSYRRAILPSVLHTQLSHLNTLSCATFVRRSVIERGFFLKTEWKAIADAVWVADMIKAKLRMAVLPEALAAFTLTAENLGQSSLAIKEGQRWVKQTTHNGKRALKPLVVAWHRVHKLFSGAYALRSFSTAIYTETSAPGRRMPATSANLSFRWTRSSENIGLGLLIWKKACDFFRALFSNLQPLQQRTLSFSFYHPPRWPLVCRLGLPFVLAAFILYFEQASGPAVVVAPMLSVVLMSVISFFLPPAHLVPFAALFTATIYWSIHYMQPFNSENPTDWIRLGLRLGAFCITAALAILFSKSRCEAKTRQDQTIAMITSMPVPVIISDPLGVILFANDEAVEFTGLRRGTLIGTSYPRLFMGNQDEGSAMRDYIKFFQATGIATGSSLSEKRDICLTLGGKSPGEIQARVICLGEGEFRYMVTVIKG